jgi:phosphohistidine phosphatase
MDCILVRHGIAVEPEEWTGPEADRPLTEKGIRRVREAAAGLAALGIAPTHLWSSPYARARETAVIIRRSVCRSLSLELRDELAIGSAPQNVVALLRQLPQDAIVLCVGHEPLLGETAGLLLSGRPSSNYPMKKAGAAWLQLEGEAAPGRARLHCWLQPAQLRALGKR